jgi:dolichol-phosphate mannosyltransferase
MSGMNISTGDACVLLDGDLQDPPELIEDFVENWKKGFDVPVSTKKKTLGDLANDAKKAVKSKRPKS